MSPHNIVFHNYYTTLNQNNFMFEHEDVPGVGEGLLKPMQVIRHMAEGRGIRVGTWDNFPIKEAVDGFVFLDLPKESDPVFRFAKGSCRPLYLMLLESPLIRPENYQRERHQPFRRIFTWDPHLVDGDRYVKTCIAQNPTPALNFENACRDRLLALITSKRASGVAGELYSRRQQAIEFYEHNHPGDFGLYGRGWDRDVFRGLLRPLNILNLFPFRLPFALQKRYRVYCGPAASKLATLGRYRFSICFENCATADGYITEKLFDSLYAGCIPVYLGAPDITRYVPSDCFVDMRQFASFADLHRFISTMSESDRLQYQHAIRRFLGSDAYHEFSPSRFAERLLHEIANG